MKPAAPEPTRKSAIDTLLLKLPGVVAKKINGLDAYLVGDKMFACISGEGVGLRLPSKIADELQFSRANVGHFNPGGMSSTREWIQINRADAADYAQDAELFATSHAFVKAARSR
jgi:predicted DNA-binding protein (MmcQ/YjbR family)